MARAVEAAASPLDEADLKLALRHLLRDRLDDHERLELSDACRRLFGGRQLDEGGLAWLSCAVVAPVFPRKGGYGVDCTLSCQAPFPKAQPCFFISTLPFCLIFFR